MERGCLRACLENAFEIRSTGFGVPPLGGFHVGPPKGGTPNRISKHARTTRSDQQFFIAREFEFRIPLRISNSSKSRQERRTSRLAEPQPKGTYPRMHTDGKLQTSNPNSQ